MELLYVFNESVSTNFCSAFEQSFQIIISGASTRWHHWSLERFRLWFLLISFFQQVSLCFRIISMLKHPLPYLFYSVNCGLLLQFLHPNRFCTLLDSIINKCMHLKVFVNYCTLVTFRAVVTDVGIFFPGALLWSLFGVWEMFIIIWLTSWLHTWWWFICDELIIWGYKKSQLCT